MAGEASGPVDASILSWPPDITQALQALSASQQAGTVELDLVRGQIASSLENIKEQILERGEGIQIALSPTQESVVGALEHININLQMLYYAYQAAAVQTHVPQPLVIDASANTQQLLDGLRTLFTSLVQGSGAAGDPGPLGKALSDGADSNFRSWFGVFPQNQAKETSLAQSVAGNAAGAGASLVTNLMGTIATPAQAAMRAALGQGPVTPDDSLSRGLALLATCSGLGLLAHGISSALSLEVLGNGFVNTAGIGACLAELSSFGPVLGAITEPFNAAYFGQAWERYVNKTFLPFHPGLGEILTLRARRFLDPGADTTMIGTDTADALKEHGLSDDWQDKLVKAAYRWPRQRELMILAETEHLDDEYLTQVFEKAGFDDTNVGNMVEAFKARRNRPYRQKWLDTSIQEVVYGFITVDQLDVALRAHAWPDDLIQPIHEAAAEARWLQWSKEYVDWAQLAYSRDELSDTEFTDALQASGMDATTANRLYAIARLKRYHKVWLTTPQEDAKAVLSTYLAAFRANIISRFAVEDVLAKTGMDPSAALMMVDMADEARQAALIAELRQFGLPALRDEVVSGQLTIGEYQSRLQSLGFPMEKWLVELGFVYVLIERYKFNEFQRSYVPAVERAYVQGLVGRSSVTQAYAMAKVPTDEAAVRLSLLDNELRQRLLGRYVSFEQSADRAAVIAGTLSPDDYRKRLETAGWPAAYVLAEVDFATAERDRRTSGHYAKYALAKYEQAYKLGLCGVSDLLAAYDAAGLSQAEWGPRLAVLNAEVENAAAKISASQAAKAGSQTA